MAVALGVVQLLWLRVPMLPLLVGVCSGVAAAVVGSSPAGHTSAITRVLPCAGCIRSSCCVLLYCGAAGKIIQQWGAGVFYMPHMLTVDRNNTVWVTDVGRHQALQFSASGKLLQEVGVKMEPGHDHAHLCKPTQVWAHAEQRQGCMHARMSVQAKAHVKTDVEHANSIVHAACALQQFQPTCAQELLQQTLIANLLALCGVCAWQVAFLNDGSFLISDGYCNSRVLRFNPDGTFHSEYKLSNGRGKQHRDMVVPHSLVVDECDNTVMVADRENRAVHTFNLQTGDFIRE